MSGRSFAHSLDALVVSTAVIECEDVHDDCARAEGGAFGALSGHRAHEADHHDLQTAARGAGGDVGVHADVAALGADDRAVADEGAAGEFLDLAHGVEHADGHVLEGGLDGRGSLTAHPQAVLTIDQLDEDRLGGGGSAVSGQDGAKLEVALLMLERWQVRSSGILPGVC